MIKLSRLGRQEIAINCDLIAFVEACPDTTLRMIGGDSLIVTESVEEVLRRISAYRSGILRAAGLGALLTPWVRPAAALPGEDGENGIFAPGDAALSSLEAWP
jgi:flagellar protein FlbD